MIILIFLSLIAIVLFFVGGMTDEKADEIVQEYEFRAGIYDSVKNKENE